MEIALVIVALGWAPGRALAKAVGPWAEFVQAVFGALGFHVDLQGIRFGSCKARKNWKTPLFDAFFQQPGLRPGFLSN